MITDALYKTKGVIETLFVKVIKEQATDATGFIAMFQIKVFITPFFESRIVIRTKGVTSGPGALMPVLCIFFKSIIRR